MCYGRGRNGLSRAIALHSDFPHGIRRRRVFATPIHFTCAGGIMWRDVGEALD